MSGSMEDVRNMFKRAEPKECPHNVIRKKRTADPHEYMFDAYVCGSCATIFEVKKYEESKPGNPEPMFDGRKPWGTRSRQA